MKDTNTTLLVGLLGVIIIALAAFLAIAISKTDPVVIIGFAGTILGGLFAFLRAGQAADEAAKAKREAALSADITAKAATTVQEIKVSIDGRMEDLLTQTKLAAANSATLVERQRGEEKAAGVAVTTDAALAVAQSQPAIGPVPNLLTGEPYGQGGDGGAPAGTPAVELSPGMGANMAATAANTAAIAAMQVTVAQSRTDPVPVIVIQPEDSPIPVLPVEVVVKQEEETQ